MNAWSAQRALQLRFADRTLHVATVTVTKTE